MAGPRKRLFGPLFYGTVVFALLATAYTWVETAWPAIQERQELLSQIVETGPAQMPAPAPGG